MYIQKCMLCVHVCSYMYVHIYLHVHVYPAYVPGMLSFSDKVGRGRGCGNEGVCSDNVGLEPIVYV